MLRRLNQRQATGWESPAWKDYETVPAIQRADDYHADNMSRIRLYVGRPDPTGVNAPEEIRDPAALAPLRDLFGGLERHSRMLQDRKSTRLNSSHVAISYAVFCLKKTRDA